MATQNKDTSTEDIQNLNVKIKKKPGFMSRFRTLARLAAIQALYQVELLKTDSKNVMPRFLNEGLMMDEDKVVALREPKLFKQIVEGTLDRLSDIDGMIEAATSGDVNFSRFEPLLKNILRAGIYELLASLDVPSPVLINEYLDISHLYYMETEPKIVNGILNKLAKKLRDS